MKDLFISLFDKPMGIVLFQLVGATQFTIYLSLIAFIGGGLLGALVLIARTLPSKTTKRIGLAYTWLFQSVPLLMLLFLSGLGVPRLFGLNVDPWFAAVVSLTLYASAYLAEVWRGAVEAVGQGQWEGAQALGLRFWPILRKIIIPQAIQRSLAPTVGFLVQIIKGTSLAYIIGFHDLMAIGRRWANAPIDGTDPFIIYPLMALIYFALCFPLSVMARQLEKRSPGIGARNLVSAT